MAENIIGKLKRRRELKTIIPQRQSELKALKDELKKIDNDIQKYIVAEQPNGFSYSGEEFRLKETVKTKAKNKDEKIKSIAETILALEEISDDNVRTVAQKIMDSLKGTPVTQKQLKTS
jgi:DNA mismatch repair ATPase MutL